MIHGTPNIVFLQIRFIIYVVFSLEVIIKQLIKRAIKYENHTCSPQQKKVVYLKKVKERGPS